MRKLESLLLIPLLAAAGCSCLSNVAYRPIPGPARIERADAIHAANAHAATANAFANSAAPASFAAAQEGHRNPETAFCLACLIAGGGHFYTGETTKGAVLAGIAAGALIGGAALSSSGDYGDCEYNPETFDCEESNGRLPLWIGAGIAAGSWLYGIIDARASAERVNARNGRQGAVIDTRPWLGLRRGQPSAGLQFQLSW
ncbi:MAG: hypothetical protein ACRERX_21235 [Pseudomonas sp.]